MDHRPLPGRWLSEAAGEAPPPFSVGGSVAAPIRMASLELRLEADVTHGRAHGWGRLRFGLPEPGCPLLDLVPDPTRLVLDGAELPPERLRLVTPPDETTPLRMLDVPLSGPEHELEIEYPLPQGDEGTLRFGDGGVQLGLFMSDLKQRSYLERHAPANLEFDQCPITLEVRIPGATRSHRLFTNGQVAADGNHAWQVTFPDYFTCSSCYLHLTDRPLEVREGSFAGAEREVPVTVYGEETDKVERAMKEALGILRELEDTFGPYAHRALLVYCTAKARGGMEYAGATTSSPDSLGHEITHSWFARGVMPANGNAGWIDEAIAQWREAGYPRAKAAPQRPPVNLAGFSPYRRDTPRASYDEGALLLSELDRLFAPGGLLPILARFYREKQRRVITTPSFLAFLERETGAELGAVFDRYVYGNGGSGAAHRPGRAVSPAGLFRARGLAPPPPPPRSFTAADLHSLL